MARRQNTTAALEPAPTPTDHAPVGVQRLRGVLTEAPLSPTHHVRIQTADGVEHRFEATDELAQRVFELRGAEVVAMCTRGDAHPRVIWLYAADQVPAPPDPDVVLAHNLKRWAKTLEILAQ